MKAAGSGGCSFAAILAMGAMGLGVWSAFAAPSVAHSAGIGIDTGVSSKEDGATVGAATELRYMTSSAAAIGRAFTSAPPAGLVFVLR